MLLNVQRLRDMGLLVFFIIMLFTESKNRQHINYLRKQRQKGKVKMSNRFLLR